jgi:hypothetical protein
MAVVAAAVAAAAVAFLHGGNLVVVDTGTHSQRVVLRHAGIGPVRWSGDGRLVSSGGKIAGGPALPTAQLTWAPRGETAAYLTRAGALFVWSPSRGKRRILPASWGAQAVAWSRDGRLAIGRSVCHRPCGIPTHREVWVWRKGSLRRIVDHADGTPMPARWDGRGRVIWWLWPGSGSIAADGVAVYAGARRVGAMLMYRDYLTACGRGLAFASGGDRNSMHGKSIVYDGQDVSRDRSRSWTSPSCNASGSLLVAAAGKENTQGPWSHEHRAIWQLLPARRQLTRPPAGWTDEAPLVLHDDSVLFVRTRQTARKVNGRWYETDRGRLELWHDEVLSRVADLTYTSSELSGASLQYYGHYDWEQRLAVRP